ncbi:hypothetical protein A2U01_0103848, partial [Trifolium medium]|nr:hypothetical protein [Trifolium medium]
MFCFLLLGVPTAHHQLYAGEAVGVVWWFGGCGSEGVGVV